MIDKSQSLHFNPLVHELVGSRATILESSCQTLLSTSGQIVFESRNMIQLRTDAGLKKISKKVVQKLLIENEFGACFISGSSIIGRPEERILRTN